MILLLCDDLLFASRITGTARGLNYPISVVKTSSELVNVVREKAATCVILDLSNPGLFVDDVLSRLNESSPAMPFVAAFGSHVDAETLRAARDAGCDVVWPRSKFADELATVLPTWMTTRPES